jgi:hypothetical protein
MEDTFCHQALINKSNYGMLRETVSTQLKTTTIKIGSQKLDLSQLPLKHQPQGNSFPLLDGTDILKSGITKPSTLRTPSEPMIQTSTLLQFLQEETTSSPAEKIKKLEFSTLPMLKSQPQCTMLDHQLTAWLLTQDATGSQLELKTDGKFGTSNQKILQLSLTVNTSFRERKTYKKSKARRSRLINSIKLHQLPGTPSETDYLLVSATVLLKLLKSLKRKLTEVDLIVYEK